MRNVSIEGCGGTQWLSELGRWTGGRGHCGLPTVEFLTLRVRYDQMHIIMICIIKQLPNYSPHMQCMPTS